MSRFVIEGGHALHGTVVASGNKNAALAVLPACLLTDEPVTLHNIPNILDVRNTLLILQSLGAQVTALDDNSYSIHAENVPSSVLQRDLAMRTRASFIFSGPLLARLGSVDLPVPGGDVIGGRPLDTHVQGLQALGAEVTLQRDHFVMQTPGLTGAGYLLQPEASVTATENTVMAAVLAKGTTILDNAACEPHVRDLCQMLVQMGAQIDGVGSNRLTIQGVDRLHGTEFRIGSDFMEVGSYIGAAAVTQGSIRIENASPGDLSMVAQVYGRLGVVWQTDGNALIVPSDQPLEVEPPLSGGVTQVKPAPWPGFPPDLMSIAVVIATQSRGTVLLHDWMYESRFFFVDKLNFMGARTVLCDPHRVLVQGPARLQGGQVSSPDIRAGMAMLLAALCARGTSTIGNIHQIDRGYENIDAKLNGLGAQIRREAGNDVL
jgi:UDP-N-acetylglucosamine 1-carboxyvinyltransferase